MMERGDKVRLLCAIPECGLEAGSEATVLHVWIGDDLLVALDFPALELPITLWEDELWWLEAMEPRELRGKV
jgi:hypothetical protein